MKSGGKNTKMLDLSILKNKAITILGGGITGLSCARFLMKHQIPFALNDSRPNAIDLDSFQTMFPDNQLSLGHWDQKLIKNSDILLVSPGIDLATTEIQQAINPKGEVFGDVELFCRLTNIPTIAVTGSNGKSTVVSLLAYLGDQLGYKTQLGGNIGIPVLDTIEQAPDFLILELSSFQLETLTSLQPLSASVLNLCDDHLDRHQTIENYQAIKANVYKQADVSVFNRDDQRTFLPETLKHKKTISFGINEPVHGNFGFITQNNESCLAFGDSKLIAVNKLPLPGMHNALNCLSVLALGYAAGWPLSDMVSALSGFKGLAHRCQPVDSHDNIQWINDSKATNIGATIAAINGFSQQKLATSRIYLIAGGEGKGADFSELLPYIEAHIEHVFTFGKDGDKILALTDKASAVSDLSKAVSAAKQQAVAGDIVLLSPACASIDMFKNYMERGLAFEKAVSEVQPC